MSIRYKLIVLTSVMIAAMIAIATLATIMTNRFASIADSLYDRAFIGVHYAHKVEVGFVFASRATMPRSGRPIPAKATAPPCR